MTNDQCASGVCVDDGTCAVETDIAYVDPGGSQSSDCTRAAPCSLVRGLTLTRQFVLLAPGGYQNNMVLTVAGKRSLIGAGPTPPTIQRTTNGPIITTGFQAEATLDNLELFGATTGANGTGTAIEIAGAGTKLVLRRSVIRQNAGSGVNGTNANVEVTDTTFSNNANGIHLTDSRATIDRCIVNGSTTKGLSLDAGVYVVRNSFIVRNPGTGIDIFPSELGNVVEFNTIVDNTFGLACTFATGTPETPFPNNIIARNTTNTTTTVTAPCTYPGSIIAASIASLNFVSPDAAPFDYHIQTGSMAVGAAGVTTLDHDFDGDPRPASGADVGADEL